QERGVRPIIRNEAPQGGRSRLVACHGSFLYLIVKSLKYRTFVSQTHRSCTPQREVCMSKYISRLGAPFVMVAALAFSACTVSDSKSHTAAARDTALNRDLELANRDSAVQPQLKDVPAT